MLNPWTHIIKDFGKKYTLRKVLNGAYNVTTGSYAVTETDYETSGMFYQNVDSIKDTDTNNKTYKKMLLAIKQTNGLTLPKPDSNDKIVETDGSVSYDIMDVSLLNLKGGAVFYTLFLRG